MIEGSKIIKVRQMTDEEYQKEGWYKCPHKDTPVLELDNGCLIYPSKDAEGNDSGALFGVDAERKNFFTVA